MEPFYCGTLDYAENHKKASASAKGDVYSNRYHAYDICHPFTRSVKEAINGFKTTFVLAAENCCAPQK